MESSSTTTTTKQDDEKKKKKKISGDNNSLKRIIQKPRHSVRMSCKECGWAFRGGGFETEAQALEVEKKQKELHDSLSHGSSQNNNNKELNIERDSHAAEIPHAYVEQTTAQPTTSTTYVDVPGALIDSSNFTVSERYLLLVTAQYATGSTTADLGYVRVLRTDGSNSFPQSESAVEMVNSAARGHYMWWTVWTAVAGNGVKLQFMTSGTGGPSIELDQISMTAIRLTPDLVEGKDWANSSKSTAEALTLDTDSNPANNGIVTITPELAGHRWLILSKSRFGVGIDTGSGMQSRIKRSGSELVNEFPVMQQEGEDGSGDIYLLCGARVDTLQAVSNTYEEISTVKNTGNASASGTRRSSGIFIMDLDKFKNVAFLQEDGPANSPPNSSTTDFAEQIATKSITPTQAGDVFVLGHMTIDWGGSGRQGKWRLQIDDTDYPASQTTNAYAFDEYDTNDRQPYCLHTVQNLTAAAHTIDMDGSLIGTGQSSPGSYTRMIVAFSMELSPVNLIPVQTDNIGITEDVSYVIGSAGNQVKTESIGIEETVQAILSSATGSVTADSLQIRFSGGADNLDPDLSLGGDMSFVPGVSGAGGFLVAGFLETGFVVASSSGGIGGTGATIKTADFLAADYEPADFRTIDEATAPAGLIESRLLDNVSTAEAVSGDTGDYRCFYVYNAHETDTMRDLTIWIYQNTPAKDEVQIGLGSSDISVAEQTIADEDTAPTNVTFGTAQSFEEGIFVGDLGPGDYKAIWIKRVVPAGTENPYYNNTYSLKVRFLSAGYSPEITTDIFGVPKKYPDSVLASAPAVWEMGIGNYASRIRQWNAGTGTGFTNAGSGFTGSGFTTSGFITGIDTVFDSDQGTSNVRWIVYAGPGIDYTLSTAARQTLLNRGDPNDGIKRGGYMADGGINGTANWRDVEITTCLYLYDMSGDNDCGWFCRGGTHSGADGIGVSAEGSCYHPGLFYATGDSEIAKEQWHTSYASGRIPDSKNIVGDCVGQWIWLKFIFRNAPASGAYASPYQALPHIPVVIETWIIKTGLTDPDTLPDVATTAVYSNWVRLMIKTDNGGWGTVGGQNDAGPGPADTILSYGGPEVTFRADRDSSNTGYGHIRCCYTSVREIDPTAEAYW